MFLQEGSHISLNENLGFTLFELVIVIIILGILAATSLPRFSGLEDKASSAVAKDVREEFVSRVTMVRTEWIAGDGSTTSDSGIDITGDEVLDSGLNSKGWIEGSWDNGTIHDCDHVLSVLLEHGPISISVDDDAAFIHSSGNSIATNGTAGQWHGIGNNAIVGSITECSMVYAPDEISSGEAYHFFTYNFWSGTVSAVSTAVIP